MGKTIQTTAVIDASGTTSGECTAPKLGYELVGIFIPVMTGTALTLTAASAPAGTFVAVKNAANTAISITVDGTAHLAVLDPTLYRGLENFKFVSNGTEASARTLTLVWQKRPA